VALNSTIEKTFTPSAAVDVDRRRVHEFDLSRTTSDRLSAGNLFRSVRDAHNATVTFSFRADPRPLAVQHPDDGGVFRGRQHDVPAARGQDTCVPYVDSRQTQAQLTMDTDLPRT